MTSQGGDVNVTPTVTSRCDAVVGGAVHLTLTVTSQCDTVVGGAVNVTLSVTSQSDTVVGGAVNLTPTVTSHCDTVVGDAVNLTSPVTEEGSAHDNGGVPAKRAVDERVDDDVDETVAVPQPRRNEAHHWRHLAVVEDGDEDDVDEHVGAPADEEGEHRHDEQLHHLQLLLRHVGARLTATLAGRSASLAPAHDHGPGHAVRVRRLVDDVDRVVTTRDSATSVAHARCLYVFLVVVRYRS